MPLPQTVQDVEELKARNKKKKQPECCQQSWSSVAGTHPIFRKSGMSSEWNSFPIYAQKSEWLWTINLLIEWKSVATIAHKCHLHRSLLFWTEAWATQKSQETDNPFPLEKMGSSCPIIWSFFSKFRSWSTSGAFLWFLTQKQQRHLEQAACFPK